MATPKRLWTSKARTDLAAWMEANNVRQSALAKHLKVKQPSVWQWLHGVAQPSRSLRLPIEVATGKAVKQSDWSPDRDTVHAPLRRIRTAKKAA